MKKLTSLLAVTVSATAFVTSASALEYKPYVGLDYVRSAPMSYNAREARPQYDSASVNVGTTYNAYFGTELFFQDSYKEERHDTRTSYKGYGLDLVGYLPLGCDRIFNLLGTAGVGEYKFDLKESGANSSTDTGLGYRFGAGAQYHFDDNWSARALVRYVEFDNMNTLDHTVEYVVGGRYSF